MFGYMLASLVLFGFAATVLMLPAFRSDLLAFAARDELDEGTERATEREVAELAQDISVVIPARNEEKTLPALLDSLETQTVCPCENIVVDDQSEDQTAAVATREFTRVVSAAERPPA